jgi:hypothetical protein
LTNQQILLGKKYDRLEIIKIYPEDEWEQFVREWLEGIRGKYTDVRRAGGSRDKGPKLGRTPSTGSRGGILFTATCPERISTMRI